MEERSESWKGSKQSFRLAVTLRAGEDVRMLLYAYDGNFGCQMEEDRLQKHGPDTCLRCGRLAGVLDNVGSYLAKFDSIDAVPMQLSHSAL